MKVGWTPPRRVVMPGKTLFAVSRTVRASGKELVMAVVGTGYGRCCNVIGPHFSYLLFYLRVAHALGHGVVYNRLKTRLTCGPCQIYEI
jgi:hypothetical protein